MNNTEQSYKNFLLSTYAWHLVIIVPLLFFVGIKRDQSPGNAFAALLLLGALTLFYHGVGFITLLLGTSHGFPLHHSR